MFLEKTVIVHFTEKIVYVFCGHCFHHYIKHVPPMAVMLLDYGRVHSDLSINT